MTQRGSVVIFKYLKNELLPENPGVRAAIFLARFSLSNSSFSFSGLRWTLNIDALPLISGGPAQNSRGVVPLI